MNRHRRRGVSLTQVLGMLPLIVAIGAVAFQVTNGMLRFQERVRREAAEQARMADLVRRIQLDAAQATAAEVESDETGSTLRLAGVTYRSANRQVTRTQQPGVEPEVSFSWTFDVVHVQFAMETMGGEPRVAWVTFRAEVPVEKGPPMPQKCAAAAQIGRGGAS